MRSERTSRRMLSWLLSLSLPIFIVGLAFWARAAAEDGLELGVKASQIEKGEARALAQQLKVAVIARGEGHVEVAMRVQPLADDVGAAAATAAKADPAGTASGEPAAKASGTPTATPSGTLAQKKQALRYTKRVRTRAKQKGDVGRALLDDAARLATKGQKGDAEQAKKAGSNAKQAGAEAKGKGGAGSGAHAARPHASPESLRGSKGAGASKAGGAKGSAKGSGAGVGAAKKGGGGSLLRSSSPGVKGSAGSGAGKGRR